MTRRPLGVLLGVLGAALGLRFVVLLFLRDSPYFGYLLWDEQRLHDWAAAIAGGTYEGGAVYENSPLPAYLFSLLYRLLGPDALWIRLANLALGTGTCFAVYLVGREVFDHKVGFAACVLAAAYGPLVLYSAVPLKTSLSGFLYASILYLFLRALARPRVASCLALGVVIGLAVSVRANYLLLLPVIAVGLVWLRRRDGMMKALLPTLLVLAGFAAATAPVLIRNYRVAGEATLTTSQAGFNLYIGNNLDVGVPYYRPVPFATTEATKQGIQFTIEASRRVGRRLTPQEASSYWTKTAVEKALERPGTAVGKLALKIVAVLHRFEAGDHYDLDFLSEHVPVFRVPFLGLGLILPLAAFGFVRRGWGSPGFAWLIVGAAIYGATLVAFYTNARYRLPISVLLLVPAAAGLLALVEDFRARRGKKLALGLGAGLVVFALQSLPIPGAWDRTAYLNTHATVLARGGDLDAAAGFWRESAELRGGFSDFALASLARLHLGAKDPSGAISYLKRIPEDSYVGSVVHEIRGDLELAGKRPQVAAREYERAVMINSGRLQPRQKLVRLLAPVDRERTLAAHAELLEIRSYYPGK